MKKIYLILFFILHSSLIYSQWVQTNGPDGGYVSSFTVTGNYIFAGLWDNGLYYSTDIGNNWIKSSLNDYKITCLSSSGSNIFVGAQDSGIFVSTNFGNTWIHNGLTDTLNTKWVMSILTDGTNLFASVSGYGVYKSNNGQNWVRVLDGFHLQSICQNGNTLYAGGDFWVYRSTDNGQNWTQILETQNPINCIDANVSNIFVGILKQREVIR